MSLLSLSENQKRPELYFMTLFNLKQQWIEKKIFLKQKSSENFSNHRLTLETNTNDVPRDNRWHKFMGGNKIEAFTMKKEKHIYAQTEVLEDLECLRKEADVE